MKISSVAIFLVLIWISGMFVLYSRQNNDSVVNSVSQAIRENNALLQRVAIALNQKDVNLEDGQSQIAIRKQINSKSLISLESKKTITRSQDAIEILLWTGINWAGLGKEGDLLPTPNYLGANVKKHCDIPCHMTLDR
jgi:purine nucleoside permease